MRDQMEDPADTWGVVDSWFSWIKKGEMLFVTRLENIK